MGQDIKREDKQFKELFYKFFASLTLFAEKLTRDHEVARDIAQEVFLKLWESDADFNSEIAFKTYLYLSTRNRCVDRARARKLSTVELSPDLPVPDELDVANEVIREETYRLLDEAINQLGEQTRRVIYLSMDGHTIPEISRQLGISENTTKKLKQRAHKTLREKLGDTLLVVLLGHFPFPIF